MLGFLPCQFKRILDPAIMDFVHSLVSKKRTIPYHLSFVLAFILPISLFPTLSSAQSPFQAVPGLIDIRTSFSDSPHTMEDIVVMARSRGFKIVFINDHDRVALSYGVFPFRRIFAYRKEFPSILTNGPEKYLAEIKRLSRKYPDMILIPGCITSPFYYWSGSWLKGDLTVHQYDRRLLIVNLSRPEDYKHIPIIGNGLSLRYTRQLVPGLLFFVIPFFIGLILLRWKGLTRVVGLFIALFSILAIIDYNPFRSSLFTPYDGDQGIAPYQEVIDYVKERGGLCFWNYPEQLSGVRKYGPIFVNTPPYPEVLHESIHYTGFSAIYGDRITLTDPGREWDRTLNEYCEGFRENPPWGISTADFHEDGRHGLKLGAFPTTFLVKEFSKQAVIEAMVKGRMYCSSGDSRVWPRLDYFTVQGDNGGKAFMGERLTTTHPPVIRFRVSMNSDKSQRMTLLLIRGGELLKTFDTELPMEVEYIDEGAPHTMTFYRVMDAGKHLTSNPIFVKYEP
jgi:hypothetical protein